MRFTTETKRLTAGFNLASKGASVSDLSPALTCVLITAKNDAVTLEATNTELTIRVQIDEIEVIEEGKLLIPVKLFSRILAANKNSDIIDLETEGTNLKIRSNGAFYQIATVGTELFPALSTVEPTDYYSFTAQEIVDGFNCTNFATDTENYRYALSGIHFQRGKTVNGWDVVNLVTTDGRRLSHLETGVSIVGSPSEEPVIIPAKTFSLAQQIAKNGAIDVKVYFNNGSIYFDYGSVRLSSRLLEGRFPAWEKIMPNKTERQYQTFKTEAFLTALKQASVLTSDVAPGVQLAFTDKKLALSVPNSNSGTAEIEITPEADSSDGVEITSKIDPKLAVQYLSALPAESQVTVFLKDNTSSLLFESLDIDRATSNFILMPLS